MRCLRRWPILSALVPALALTIWACDLWTAWDDMFSRASIGTDAKGWNGGDAALSSPLPGGRSVYLFGDSYATSVTTDGRRVQLNPALDPWEQLRHVVFGNTLGVMSGAEPGANNIRFYAREIEAPYGNGSVADITRVPSAQFTGYRQFFNHASLGLTPTQGRYFWPIGAECYDCASGSNARLLVALTEWETCDPSVTTDPNLCAAMCGLTGTAGGQCTQGVALKANVIVKFRNVDQAPSAWTRDGAALRIERNNASIQWGGSFVIEADGSIYVYGLGATRELFVRRTTLAALTSGNESTWTIWRRNLWGGAGWATGTAAMRAVATNIPTYYSIDKVTRNNTTRYLLTYSQLGHKLYARVSGAALNGILQAATWADEGATTPSLDLMSLDGSIRTAVNSLAAAGYCSVDASGPVPSYRHCGVTYHGLAHAEHATNDAMGVKTIPASYIVTYGPNPYFDASQPEGGTNLRFGAQDTRYYRPRFTYIDVSKLEPWCTADCWQGLVHEYVGPQPGAYDFDITQVSGGRRFYAELTPQAGTPSLSVQYRDGANVLRIDACGPASRPVCHAAPPAGAKVARVLLSGPTGSSALTMRVHHAGTK